MTEARIADMTAYIDNHIENGRRAMVIAALTEAQKSVERNNSDGTGENSVFAKVLKELNSVKPVNNTKGGNRKSRKTVRRNIYTKRK